RNLFDTAGVRIARHRHPPAEISLHATLEFGRIGGPPRKDCAICHGSSTLGGVGPLAGEVATRRCHEISVPNPGQAGYAVIVKPKPGWDCQAIVPESAPPLGWV